MSALVEMLATATLVSVLALACLRVLPDTALAGRLVAAFAGLAAWVVPWPWLHVPVEMAGLPAPALTPLANLELAREPLSSPARGGIAAFVPALAVAAVLVPGVLWFLRDYVAHRTTVRGLHARSHPDESLRRLLPRELRKTRASIRVVPGTCTALTSGLVRPTIWIGDAFACRRGLEVALVHECVHARRRDPAWIALVLALSRAYWWNPLVASLSREALLMLEAACDRRCASALGTRRYVTTLAALMRRPETPSGTPLLATARTGSFDIARLKLLSDRTRARVRDGLLVAVLTAAAGAVAGLTVVDAATPAWSRVTVPSTPAGRALTALLDAHEDGNAARLDIYLGAYTPQEIPWPLAEFTHGVELVEIIASEPYRIEFNLRDRRDGTVRTGRLDLTAPPETTR